MVDSSVFNKEREMPVVQLRYKPNNDLDMLVRRLAKALPAIVAPQLNVAEREGEEGWVAITDVIVEVTEGSSVTDVQLRDLQIMIISHDFPERVRTCEKRKDAIIDGVRSFLADYDRNVSGFVQLLLVPIAFGHI